MFICLYYLYYTVNMAVVNYFGTEIPEYEK